MYTAVSPKNIAGPTMLMSLSIFGASHAVSKKKPTMGSAASSARLRMMPQAMVAMPIRKNTFVVPDFVS